MSQHLKSTLFTIAVLLVVVWIIVGCATVQPAPPVIAHATALEPIRVPVLVPCLTREQIPTPPATWMRVAKPGDYNEIAAAIDLKELEDYVVKSQSRMWGCIKSFEEDKKP